jgi:hypothetical protein
MQTLADRWEMACCCGRKLGIRCSILLSYGRENTGFLLRFTVKVYIISPFPSRNTGPNVTKLDTASDWCNMVITRAWEGIIHPL